MLWAPDPFNRRTGKLLGYNYFQILSDYDPEKGGQYFRRTMRQPGKKMLTEEGQAFANWIKGLGEEIDPLTPWLIKQFKDNDLDLDGSLEFGDGNDTVLVVKNNAGDRATVEIDHAEEVFKHYAQWYNATDSPYRQGKNIQEMSLQDVDLAARQHASWIEEQESERQRKEELQEGMDEGNARQKTVYEWPDGWTVKELTDVEDLELESEAMQHCIGKDDQPYCDALMSGRITVYSLRDPEGFPHATWHYNPDGSLAQLQGYEGHSLKEEYRDRFEQWAAQAGMSTDSVGDQMNEAEWTITIDTVPDFINIVGDFTYETYDNFREWAESEGAYVGDETQYNIELDWKSIISSLIRSHKSYIDSARQTWMNEWGETPEGPAAFELQNREPQPNLFDYPPSTRVYGYPRNQNFDRNFQEFFTALTGENSSSERWDYNEFDPQILAEEFDQALTNYQPSQTEQEGYRALVEKWDEIRSKFTSPDTNKVNFTEIVSGPDEWPGNEWSRDPQNQPPLWIDNQSDVDRAYVFGDSYARPTLPKALPWWYSDRYSPYSEETFIPTPEYDEKKKIWNQSHPFEPKAAADINEWEGVDTQQRIDPKQLPLPGMCPNCGSADYEIGWKVPTQTTQNKYDMGRSYLVNDPDQEHPFLRGWYYYCPDCRYYEGYTGKGEEAREEQMPYLPRRDRTWDRRRERWRQFNPDPIQDPLLYEVNEDAYQRALRNWEGWGRQHGTPEPQRLDYPKSINRGVGAPGSDTNRTDPFYDYARGMIADPESHPNTNIKQPNYKSLLTRWNKTVENSVSHNYSRYVGDYTAQALVDFAVKMGQTDQLVNTAKEIIGEIDKSLSLVPNIGTYRDRCNCSSCNRKRGQQNRWKDKIIVQEIKDGWKQAYKAEQDRFQRWREQNPRRPRKEYLKTYGRTEYIKDENGNYTMDEDSNYRTRSVNRFESEYPQFRGMSYREIMRQDPTPEQIERRGRYWEPKVKHPEEDFREQWGAFTEATGLDRFELGKPRTIKARAQWVIDQVQEALTRDPSTPSDPS